MIETYELDQIGADLASAIEKARAPAVAAVLGQTFVAELATVAAGFRQRFPNHWPGAQQQLPLTATEEHV